MSSFSSSSLKEILNKSRTSFVVDKSLIVSLKINCCSAWEKILKFINNIIINTTPLGSYPRIHEFPKINYTYLNSKNLLFDLIYNPSESLFLQYGKAKGSTIKNGLEMLQIQAEVSWRIWNLQIVKY